MKEQSPLVWLAGWGALWLLLTLIIDLGAPELAEGLLVLIVGGATIVLVPGAMKQFGLISGGAI